MGFRWVIKVLGIASRQQVTSRSTGYAKYLYNLSKAPKIFATFKVIKAEGVGERRGQEGRQSAPPIKIFAASKIAETVCPLHSYTGLQYNRFQKGVAVVWKPAALKSSLSLSARTWPAKTPTVVLVGFVALAHWLGATYTIAGDHWMEEISDLIGQTREYKFVIAGCWI